MRTNQLVVAWLVAVSVLLPSSHALATFINDSATGLPSPVSTLNFTDPVLMDNDAVTNQFAGVTFSPNVYFNPEADPGITPNALGNYTYLSEPAFIDPVTITFSSPVTAAAFQMNDDNASYTFTALLNGAPVDSGTATVGPTTAYFGFTGVDFNEITIAVSDPGPGPGPFWLIGNLELGASPVPEPSTWAMMLLGFVGLGYVGYRRSARLA